jgi:hypothetical protein
VSRSSARITGFIVDYDDGMGWGARCQTGPVTPDTLRTLPRRPFPPASGANAADVFHLPGAEPVDVVDRAADHLLMGYESLFAPSDIAMLHDWLEETGGTVSGPEPFSQRRLKQQPALCPKSGRTQGHSLERNLDRSRHLDLPRKAVSPSAASRAKSFWRQPWNRYRIINTSLSCRWEPIRSGLAESSDEATVIHRMRRQS